MDTMMAYAKGMANQHRERMVFDWEKAAQIIKERGAQRASAGLRDDWEWTGGKILRKGKPVKKEKTYTFLASPWATPELEVDGDTMPCYRMESETPGWDSETYWPDEALAILSAS